MKLHTKRPVIKPFQTKPKRAPPLPPVTPKNLNNSPPKRMTVKDLHKKDSLVKLKQLRQHKKVNTTGVRKLKTQMRKLQAVKRLNKK